VCLCEKEIWLSRFSTYGSSYGFVLSGFGSGASQCKRVECTSLIICINSKEKVIYVF